MSQTSLATSSGGGSAGGDLAADFKQLAVTQPPSGLTVLSPSQPSSGHSSRLVSPAPSSGELDTHPPYPYIFQKPLTINLKINEYLDLPISIIFNLHFFSRIIIKVANKNN